MHPEDQEWASHCSSGDERADGTEATSAVYPDPRCGNSGSSPLQSLSLQKVTQSTTIARMSSPTGKKLWKGFGLFCCDSRGVLIDFADNNVVCFSLARRCCAIPRTG
jgi:hypothetical protein